MMSKSKSRDYSVVKFSRLRRLASDVLSLSYSSHVMRALIEVDITNVRQHLKLLKENAQSTGSLTAFIIAAIARAVDDNKIIQAMRDWRGRMLIYNDVDIITYIELDDHGEKFPYGLIIRAAQSKSPAEIHQEIENFRTNPAPVWEKKIVERFIYVPGILRRFILRCVFRSPRLTKKYRGTVGVTCVGMFGGGTGWGLGVPSHTLGIAVGNIASRLALEGERIVNRDFLNLTLDFDHRIVDGAPAARFANRLKKNIEVNFATVCQVPSL
jgi:pyruvate/2-oxoglutarate dehydrogenase complex dihydrolipoamide acyltransferase (E2) component